MSDYPLIKYSTKIKDVYIEIKTTSFSTVLLTKIIDE
jgi:hypothetical protein